jgi:hypothetical protein
MSEMENIPGFVRVIKQGRKTVTDLQAAFQLLNKEGIENKDFVDALSCSLPKLTKVYAEKSNLPEKIARKELEKLLTGCIEIGAESISMVKKAQ